LSLEKLINEKHVLIKKKIDVVFRKIFSFYFRRKILSRNYKNIRNIMLFADYIKFDPKTFDCYIFCFEIFFQFHRLKFDFYIKFLFL
jgi:hypothetical protein